MKYIRNLHNIDDRVLSVSPQIGKDERPFLGVIFICNEHKYCVPLSKPKKKHEKMRDKIDFKKIVYYGNLIGVLNFNLMIPVEDVLIQKAELESEVPVCKSKSLLRIFLARVNSGYSIRRKKVGIYNSKLEVTNPKWNLQNKID